MITEPAQERESTTERTSSEQRRRERVEKVEIAIDSTNETFVIGIAAADPVILDQTMRQVLPHHFASRQNRDAWEALADVRRRKLDATPAALEAVASRGVAEYVTQAIDLAAGSSRNIGWHIDVLLWDAKRVQVAKDSLPRFLEAFTDTKSTHETVSALARALSGAFDGHGERKHLAAPDALVRAQMIDIEERIAGRRVYPYGIDGLDYFPAEPGDDTARRRMLPGAAPKQITVMTAVSGGGKTTVTSRMVLGLRRHGRKVVYGAWEMNNGPTLELLACMELNWSRSELVQGRGPVRTREGKILIEETMHAISKDVRFLANPFKRQRNEKRPSNDRNLDILQGYLEDSGCDVFVADLWKRCLVSTDPDDEEQALYRQQAMCDELGIHGILLQQQRLKDIEARPDRRPTREGIKGSGAWIEIADTIIGTHRPALFKNVPDDTLEAIVMKQRHGLWPLAVEFDWNADKGSISGGTPKKYARPGEEMADDATVGPGGKVGQLFGKRGKR